MFFGVKWNTLLLHRARVRSNMNSESQSCRYPRMLESEIPVRCGNLDLITLKYLSIPRHSWFSASLISNSDFESLQRPVLSLKEASGTFDQSRKFHKLPE